MDRFGGDSILWQKVKGVGVVDVDGGRKAELHWYQEKDAGIVNMRLKPQKGGALFIDED